MTKPSWIVYLGCALFLIGLGVVIGYQLRDGMQAPEVIAHAPEDRQADGSLVLERQPDAAPGAPPHALPRGAVEERRVSVVVQTKPRPRSGAKPSTRTETAAAVPEREPACSCPPVRVDLSLIRDAADGRRVIASSPDGRVFGGLDVPVTRGMVPASNQWAAGLSIEPFEQRYGVWVDRDVGRFRFGGELKQDGRGGVETWLKAGVTFGGRS